MEFIRNDSILKKGLLSTFGGNTMSRFAHNCITDQAAVAASVTHDLVAPSLDQLAGQTNSAATLVDASGVSLTQGR